MRQILLTLLFGSLIALTGTGLNSCRTDPTTMYDTIYVHDSCGGAMATNLLQNGGFDLASTGTHDLSNGEMLGWDVYKGTPQFGAGPAADGKRGFIQIWGNGDPTVGEGITQTLAKPLTSGKSYQVSCDLAWMNDNPDNYTPYVRIRFIAFDDFGASQTIGTIQTSSTAWQHLPTAVWTADANYNHFALEAEDDNVGTNSATWAHIDNVSLTAK